ncbi:heterokaryon incompatibility protein [Diplodia corticola]|uniref:Heterokaryon incompatibility protein n=1 Tax=Diplodia corticola TaxID=236234 RepID=A0A1J9SE96_9PEZI|nr:heterokaryon incompatibility protein [Diplodia corticola]OJD37909.1 heterokaryon incompatibility protein [Diplodia corticola]
MLATFEHEIPYKSLPINFQDAISITRRLGFQYLWIDCLCILQDSKRDWEQESTKMGLVYRNSTVTISAISSPGSTHGILKDAPNAAPNPKPTVMRVFEGDGQHVEIMVERQDVEEEDMRGLQLQGPLEKRGWTLQESRLSPRHLYYGTRQIYWRCPQGYESADDTPLGNKFPEDTYDQLSPVLYSDILRQPRSEACDVGALLLDYYSLVNEYSHRKLTFDSDKLPAFSGLAQRLHPALGGDYLAGLWSSDLNNGLLWYNEMRTCRHVRSYRAPSWSWAVTNEPVITPTSLTQPGPLDLQLVEHDIIPQDRGNPYGQIVSGHLIVSALVMPLARSKQVVDSYLADDTMGLVHFDEPKEEGEAASGGYSLSLVNSDEGMYFLSILFRFGRCSVWEIDFESYYPEKYTALIVHVSESSLQGLVLRRVSDRSDGAYERVGYFETFAGEAEGLLKYVQGLKRQTLKLV